MASSLRARPLILSLLALACAAASAQSKRVEGLSHQSWSTEEGLPQSSVHSVAQTSDGFLWVGTESGLARFDGQRFAVFDQHTDPAFHSSDICCLLADKHDGLWIGTRDGLVHRTATGFAWSGTGDGLPSSEITGLARSSRGGLQVRTPEGSVEWQPAGIDVPPTDSDRGWSSQPDAVTLVTASGTRRWRAGVEVPKGRVAQLLVDRQGLAWVGMSAGLAVIDPTTGTATEIPVMRGASVLSIFEDAQGNHWIGTESSGLHILRQLLFHDIPTLAGSATTAVVETRDGAMWVGTRDAGLFRIRDGVVDQPIPGRALTSSVILSLQPALDSAGGLWVGTPDGLNRIRGDNSVRQITSSDGLPDDYIGSLAVAPDGSLWIGTRHGLDHLQGIEQRILTSQDGLGGDLIGAVLLDARSQDLWVATSGGLSRITASLSIRTFSTADGLPSTLVTAFASDHGGRLWVAARDGSLAMFDGNRFQPMFTLEARDDRAQTVQTMTFDPGGALWVHRSRGVERIASAQLDACRRQHPCQLRSDGEASYGRADGLANDEAIATATAMPWLTLHGELWIPTRAGIAIADTTRPDQARQDVPVTIERVLVDDQPLVLNGGIPQVAYGSRRLSIEYAGLDFTAPSAVRYRGRLDGFDKDWQALGNRRFQTYTNLAPGLYTFHLQARSNDGQWGTNEATLQLRILSPFYRQWWFLALLLLLSGAIAAGISLLRLRVLRQRFEAVLNERNRMAREIHDTLTQDFVSTCLQLDLVAQHLRRGQLEAAAEQVRRARRLVTDGLAEARQSIWELRHHQVREPLPNQLAHLTERAAFATLTIHFKVQGTPRPVNPRAEREILRLTHEALVNVTRHANAERVHLTLHYSADMLMLTVEDNGAGFDMRQATQEQGHFGLVGMKERASVVSGSLEIESTSGEGTTVRLRVPLAANREEHASHE